MTVIGKDQYSENMLKNRRYKASKCPQCKARTHEEAEKLCRPTQDITGEYSCAGDESSLNPFGVHWDTTGRACELVAADARAEAKSLDDWCMAEMEKMEAENPTPKPQTVGEYLVWSNEHKCWWGPNHAGYVGRLADAGRYTREEAIKICVNARGGRQFNSNPSEVPLPLEDAELFWPDDKEEWRIARLKHERPEIWEDEE